MKQTLFCTIVFAFMTGQLWAASNATLEESVTFTNVDSWDALGDPDNVSDSATFTGGYTATAVSVSGTLTEVNLDTWATEARVDINGNVVVVTGEQDYVGSTTVDGIASLDSPFDPAGIVSFEWFEDFDDAPDAIDQTWNEVTYQFIADSDVTEALGSLAAGSTTATGEIAHGAGIDTYTLTLPVSGQLGVLTDTDPSGFFGFDADTEIAIYDAAGVQIASNDDDNFPTDLFSGMGPLSLAAGDYTVLVSTFNANFDDLGPGSSINDAAGGFGAGDYALQLDYEPVPEPNGLALILLAGLSLLAKRRKF